MPTPKTTWHRVLSFNENQNKYLISLKKGSKVYCEATFELREPQADADENTPQGQRQIFLKHRQCPWRYLR
jgi:single-stranded DNA-binding protein